MANLITRLFNPTGVVDYLAESQDFSTSSELRMENAALQNHAEQLTESMTELMLYMEDLNWMPISGWERNVGFSLDVVKDNADRIKALLSVNPTIKKAMNARIGYIWGRGVKFEGTGTKRLTDNKRNKGVLFSSPAHSRLETQLATDGNVWAARNKQNDDVFIIPIDQIAGYVLDELDPSRVLYWLRSYSVSSKNFATGVEEFKQIKVFYPAADNTSGSVREIDGIKVDRNISVVHAAANRQQGWILGIPDILAAMFWAKAHKELFESGVTYVKAQGKFASKVVAKTRSGAQTSAARIADAPRRDPNSGEVLDTGGTAVMSGGLDYQLMGKMSGGVDFDKFDPVAGLVAVALGIPLEVILGTAQNEERALERTTVDEMQLRQKLWSEFYENLFARNVAVIWPKIRTEPEYRRIQSIEIATKSGNLTRENAMLLTLEAFGLEGDIKDFPAVEDSWAYILPAALADHNAELSEKAATKAAEDAPDPEDAVTATGAQGVTGDVGKLSDGVDNKDARDDTSDRNTKNE